MAVTVTDLITNSYYKSALVALDYTPLTDSQLDQGLMAFNEVLGRVLIDPAIVPYWATYTFTMVIGQETYFVPNLIDIETFVFFIDTVRYSIGKENFRNYWGSPKATDIETLPLIYSIKRTKGGSDVSVTPDPNSAYPAEIKGSFGLNGVDSSDLLTDLTTIYDQYYITYLTALTAQLLCVQYGTEVPSQLRGHLLQYDTLIRKRSQPLDLTNTVISTFGGAYQPDYAQANIGLGYTTVKRRFR